MAKKCSMIWCSKAATDRITTTMTTSSNVPNFLERAELGGAHLESGDADVERVVTEQLFAENFTGFFVAVELDGAEHGAPHLELLQPIAQG